ncbi:MAG: ABC transporter ATP-binding protein [Chloroflexi bacterium]|nr:ABC transporter ATP-binding protein [Chloroflexota bacterium]MDQ2829776.1 ABC transporter ATP-binding protein [Chloroflexota bacterium]
MLEFNDVHTHYGPIQVLKGVNYHVDEGEIVCLLGANGAGKTTTMKTIMGLVRPTKGTVTFKGKRIDTVPTGEIVKAGISPVPEARRIFPRMTVLENLEMGAYTRSNRGEIDSDLTRVYDLFPRLKERRSQVAGTMSGGEQQMLAMGRAMMARPSLLIMDEPSMGLSPMNVDRVFGTVEEISKQGVTVFMVEQNANMALSIANRGYVLQTGEIVLADTAANLMSSEVIRKTYLGVA